MFNIARYQIIEQVFDSINKTVYRAYDEKNEQKVIIKILKTETPKLEEIARLRQEYQITQNLDIPGIIKSLDLIKAGNSWALILEDFGGESLHHFLANRHLSTEQFLQIAIAIANILEHIHQVPIIHKDIKPSNILINPQTWQIKLTDFSIASRLYSEAATIDNPNSIEGSLAYISPEQTGRMNRSIDHRSDFYSLGVTFYEMLVGSLPFTSNDTMELVYAHIAKEPLLPHEKNPEIPEILSRIVGKLLAKTVEDRYQSAKGLKFDLETCLSQFQERGKIDSFPLGKRDRPNQLCISQKLYGRENEVRQLLNSFQRVSEGSSEFVLVFGYSGSGKTAVVKEVQKSIVSVRGYFISGKFDRLKRDIPYSGIAQAFQDLIRNLLTEGPQKIAFWKAKILEAVGSGSIQEIVEIVPDLELIVGKQPQVAKLKTTEAQKQLHYIFGQFLNVFCQSDHPLVMFLDDLQWADSASLKLIEFFLTHPETHHFLLIGAYRDNELTATHPLGLTIDKIQKHGMAIEKLQMQSLSHNHVAQLIADTIDLPTEYEELQKLSELLLYKSQGNPFCLNQFLHTLYTEQLLYYNVGGNCWQWNLDKIQSLGITDYRIVDLIVKNIQKLPKKTQNFLQIAACLGNYFDLHTLAIVAKKSIPETASALWEAIQVGLIIPLEDTYKIFITCNDTDFSGFYREIEGNINNDWNNHYTNLTCKFLHDRVQQAAYTLVSEKQQKILHWSIGKLLLNHIDVEQQPEKIFTLANQLNCGRDLLENSSQRQELVRINLLAGKKAKATAACEYAVKYFTIGLELLSPDSWEHQYELALSLHTEAAEAEYLNTNFERASYLADIVLQQANDPIDRVKAYELHIQFLMSQNNMQEAVDLGLHALSQLEISLSEIPKDNNWLVALPRLEDVDNLPEMKDAYHLAIAKFILNVASPAYNSNPQLYCQIILTFIEFCRQYGYAATSSYAYAHYGLILCALQGDIDAGYHCGQVALKLLERFNATEYKCKTYELFNAFIKPWKEHVQNTIPGLQEAIQSGLETGDLEYVGFSSIVYCSNLFFVGSPLQEVANKQKQYIDFLEKYKQEYTINYAKCWRQLSLHFLESQENRYCLNGESFNEKEALPYCLEASNNSLLFTIYLAKTILLYYFYDRKEAAINASLAAEYSSAVMGWDIFALHNFYYSLTLLANSSSKPESDRMKILRQVEKNQIVMEKWATHAPENYQHKYDLIEAEKARICQQIELAMELYDRAISGAQENQFMHEEALANELAAEFYLELGREKIARTYLTDAYYGYICWEAHAKTQDLEERYPENLAQIRTQTKSLSSEIINTTTSTTSVASGSLDLKTLVKASQSLSEELVLEELLTKLLEIVVENVGAQTGYILLQKDGKLFVEATTSVDACASCVDFEVPAEESSDLPLSVVSYAAIAKEPVVLDEATEATRFNQDKYIIKHHPKSILCTPMLDRGELIGVLYLENHATRGAFTPQRLEIVNILISQATISIKNAMLYANLESTTEELRQTNIELENTNRNLEQKVEDRTQELKQNNQSLQHALQELKNTQAQLIQTEKMSSLGQMVAGIAHEINNPINFIYGNITYAQEYVQDLLNLIQLYQQEYPEPPTNIQEQIEDIELDFLSEDLVKLLSSMKSGANRISEIVLSLRNFSRLDEAELKKVNIHEGIDSSLLILQHRLQTTHNHSEIQLVKEYGDLPKVECYAGQLNQVFMNILANAIDALEDGGTNSEQPPKIWIRTKLQDNDRIQISIADNGPGITEKVRNRLFDPFFTTKAVGSGTGLGLSISYQIVVDIHKGQLYCLSEPGLGSEFVIEIPVNLPKA
jgi:predicted ATPase/signal transduction histidine kinase/tRNA A-37 threonylcarbamoyl transferase component Bud32